MPTNNGMSEEGKETIYSTNDLLEASKTGNTPQVTSLLKSIDINSSDSSQYTAAHYASRFGHTETLKVLIDNNASLVSRSKYGSTPLMEAAAAGNDGCVRIILGESIDGNRSIDYVNVFGCTALMISAAKGQLNCTRILLENAADVTIKDSNGNTALNSAAFMGYFDCLSLLINSPAINLAEEKDKNNDGYTAAMYACLNGHSTCAELLYDSFSPIDSRNNEGETALYLSVRRKQWEVIKTLSRRKANMHTPDNSGKSPLDILSSTDRELFINNWFYSVSTKEEDNDIVLAHYFDSAYIGSLNHIVYYREHYNIKVDAVDSNGVSALMIACHNNHIQLLYYLIDNGADINKHSNFDDTALIFACESGNESIVKYLCEHGANILVQNKNNENAAWHAAKLHNTDCLRALYRFSLKDWFEALQQHVPDKNNMLVPLREFLVESGIQDPDLLKNTGARKLIAAASAGNIDRITDYLTNDIVSIDACLDNGDTSLIVAAALGNEEVVKFLINRNARIDLPNSADNTALMMACKHGKDRCVSILIEAKADINHLNKEKHNALMEAISSSSVSCVKLLLSSPDISSSYVDLQGETAVHYACKYNTPVILKLLIESRFDLEKCDKKGNSPLDFAARFSAAGSKTEAELSSIVQCAKLLLENVPSPEQYVNKSNRNGWTALHRWAHSNGSFEFLSLLQKHRANLEAVTINGDTPLLIAAQSPHFRCFHLLLLAGADRFKVNNNGKAIDDYISHKPTFLRALKEGKDFRFSEFLDAAQSNDLDAIQRLVNENVNVDASETKTKMTGLMLAASSGSLDVLKFLIQHGATVNMFNYRRDTPLIMASENGNIECLKLLLDQNSVAINERNNMGNTALHRSILQVDPQCCQLLLQHKADVTISNKAGYTPLLYASRKGRIEHLKILLQHYKIRLSEEKVNISIQKDGYDEVDINLAFFEAVKVGEADAAELLLGAGASIEFVNKTKQTAAMLASYHNHPAMLQMLIRRGIDIDKRDDTGCTALIYAAKVGNPIIISILIASHTNGHIADNRGNNALMYSALENHLGCMDLMMREEGFINIHAANNDKYTAIMLAAKMQSDDAITALARWGADGHQARQLHPNPIEFDRLFEAGTNHETILLAHLVELKHLRVKTLSAKNFLQSIVNFAQSQADAVAVLDAENEQKLHLPLRKSSCENEASIIRQQLHAIIDDHQHHKELLQSDEQLADRISKLKDHIDTYYHHAAEAEVIISSIMKNSAMMMNNEYQRVKQIILDRLHHYSLDLEAKCLNYVESSDESVDGSDLRWSTGVNLFNQAIHAASLAPLLHYDDDKFNDDLKHHLQEWRKKHQETRYAHDHVSWEELLDMKMKLEFKDMFQEKFHSGLLSQSNPNDSSVIVIDDQDPYLDALTSISQHESSAHSFSMIRFSQAKQRERDAMEALRLEVEKQMNMLKNRVDADYVSPLVDATFKFLKSRFIADAELVKEWRRFSALSTSLSSQSSLAQVLIIHLRSKKKNAKFSIDDLLDQSSLDLIALLSQFLKSTASAVGVQSSAAPNLPEPIQQASNNLENIASPLNMPQPQVDKTVFEGLRALAEQIEPNNSKKLPSPLDSLPGAQKPPGSVPHAPLASESKIQPQSLDSGEGQKFNSLQDVVDALINKPIPAVTPEIMLKHEAKIRNLFKPIFSDLLKIHAEGSVHGMLQPSQILIVRLPNSNSTLKLSTFRVVDNKVVMKERMMTCMRNVSSYSPPELANVKISPDTLMKNIPTSYGDVYSVARMMYLIVNFGRFPDDKPNELTLSDFVSPPLRHLLSGCLLPPPLKRLTSAQCHNHEFFGGLQTAPQKQAKQAKQPEPISPMELESKQPEKDKKPGCCTVM